MIGTEDPSALELVPSGDAKMGWAWVLLALDALLFLGLVVYLHRRRGTKSHAAETSGGSESSIRMRRSTKRKAPAKRQHVQHAVRHDAVLVDVNNIRGGMRFEHDVDHICYSLYRWANEQESDDVYVVLCVDHGPSLQAFMVGDRVVVSFAGTKLEADDAVVLGVHHCTQHAQHVLVASSDSNLRLRCRMAAAGSKARLSFESRYAEPVRTGRKRTGRSRRVRR